MSYASLGDFKSAELKPQRCRKTTQALALRSFALFEAFDLSGGGSPSVLSSYLYSKESPPSAPLMIQEKADDACS
jgi:hypothetical protein